ncbi:transglutaminase-like cysteine peptidase [Chelatococcus reniformis]|uniref:Transglutaminase n=1 Tax=Chelatococcus reniformis TaxID=1494448 RepID=A0A916XH74_9HYPH|nr:transglutaminase-like cysteine peptidase [Chelatococcus reniformis]GGC71625.1 transglutaminase [Chelatococcus reniformis]
MVAAAILVTGVASAQDLRTAALPADPAEAFASVAGKTTAPMGWVGFCKENPADCDVTALEAREVRLTPAVWRLLVAVNTKVNRSITPETDEDHWGIAERWNYPDDGRGDCEDFALVKRRALMEAGLPRQALLMTVVRDNMGEGHAVLTVVTNRGELILDNKRSRILSWDKTGFAFIKRQSAESPNTWVSLGEPMPATATAAH